jgi:CubicO group peptidase (beta-lactamase class C family)
MPGMRHAAVVVIVGFALVATNAAERRITRLDGSRVTTTEIDATVKRLMQAGRVTGVGLAILNDRRVAYLRAYGERDTKKHLPLTIDSVMTAASFTKSTLAFLVMQLVQERTLDLDTPVQRYLSSPLPEYSDYADLAGDDRVQRITPRMLLSHTAGFPNLRVFNMGRLNINFEPGSRYAYSGEGIRLLQFVVEEVMHRPVQALMQERIFRRFGMARTSMVWEPAFESDYANGYDEYGRSFGPQRRRRSDAAGSMKTTLADFSRFVEGVARGRGLNASTRALMLRPQVGIRSRTQFPTLSTETTDTNAAIALSYGLGWGVFSTPIGPAFFKEGHDDGWQHYVVVFDKPGTGIVIMTNSSNGEGIFQQLLEQVIGNTYTPIEWEGYAPHDRRPPLAPLPEHRAIALDADVLDRYVGRYRAEGQLSWTIARRDDRLTLTEDGDADARVLAPESELTFFANPIDGRVTFERDDRGRVVALRMLRWPGRFVKVE